MGYIHNAAQSLLSQGMKMIQSLPEGEMYISGKAVNADIKGVFSECDFMFALFVERDDDRPGRKFVGFSVLTSLVCASSDSYWMNGTKAELFEFLDKEKPVDQFANELFNNMDHLYDYCIG